MGGEPDPPRERAHHAAAHGGAGGAHLKAEARAEVQRIAHESKHGCAQAPALDLSLIHI